MHQKYVLKTSCGIRSKLKMCLLAAVPRINSSAGPELLTRQTEDHFGVLVESDVCGDLIVLLSRNVKQKRSW